MAAYVYAMDAMLYMTTGMLDRNDQDIMVETALCKVFCSEMGWRAVNSALQVMGGEGYMTENEVERIFRDSRINIIVEGANEVMHSFIFAYGGKQLGEWMLGVKRGPLKEHDELGAARQGPPPRSPALRRCSSASRSPEVYLGISKLHRTPAVSAELLPVAERLCNLIREFTYQFKGVSKRYDAKRS